MQIDLRPRDLGENLGLVFTLALRHFGPLFLLFGVLSLPQLALQILQPQIEGTADLTAALSYLATGLVMLIAMPVATGAATAIAAASFTGDRMPLGRALGVGLRNFLAVIGYSLVTTLLIAALPLFFALAGAAMLAAGAAQLSFAPMFLAGVALLYPGLALLARFYVGVPAIITESLGVGAAMHRSTRLTQGRRGEVFVLFLVVTVVAQVVPSLLIGVASVLTLGPDAAAEGVLPLPLLIAGWLVGVAAGIVSVVAPVVIYFSLRCAKESFDVDQLAALVDEIGARSRSS